MVADTAKVYSYSEGKCKNSGSLTACNDDPCPQTPILGTVTVTAESSSAILVLTQFHHVLFLQIIVGLGLWDNIWSYSERTAEK